MARYLPSSFFAFLWTETKSRSINSQKKDEANMYGLLTKCEVKMAGYWPSSFFACLWTATKFYVEANSARSFQNAFCKCSRALTIMFLKTSYFWWIVSFFSLILNLCHLITPVNPQWKSKSKSQTGWYVSSLLADKLIVFFLNLHV